MNNELNNISNKEIENDNLIISNPELGDIMINTTTGKISCEVLNDKENNMCKNFPVEYKMKDFEIPYPKEWNFEKSNDIIIENLKFVLNIKGEIKRVITKKHLNFNKILYHQVLLKFKCFLVSLEEIK